MVEIRTTPGLPRIISICNRTTFVGRLKSITCPLLLTLRKSQVFMAWPRPLSSPGAHSAVVSVQASFHFFFLSKSRRKEGARIRKG